MKAQGDELSAKGKHSQSLEIYRQVLALNRKIHAEAHEEIFHALQRIAKLCEILEDFDGAKQAGEQAIEVRKQLAGEDHWSLIDLMLLMRHCEQMQKMSKAERQEAVDVETTYYQVLRLQSQGDYKAALEQTQRVLPLAAKRKDHAMYAHHLGNLAAIWGKVGSFEQADATYEEAIRAFAAIYGERHPNYATVLNDRGILYYRAEKWGRAEELLLQALVLRKELLETSSPFVLSSLKNVAHLYNDKGEPKEAEKYLIEARELLQTRQPQNSQELAKVLDLLVLVQERSGRHDAAGKSVAALLEIREQQQAYPAYEFAALKARHALLVRTAQLNSGELEQVADAAELHNESLQLESAGNFRPSLEIALQSLEIRQSLLGEAGAFLIGPHLALIGRIHAQLNNLPEAERYYREAAEVYKGSLGESHPSYAICLADVGGLQRMQGKYAEAESLLKTAWLKLNYLHGPRHQDSAQVSFQLGLLYASTKKHEHAKGYLEQAIFFYGAREGTSPKTLMEALGALATVHFESAEYENAASGYEALLELFKKYGLSQNVNEIEKWLIESWVHIADEKEEQHEYSAALPLREKALQMRTRLLGNDHWETVEARLAVENNLILAKLSSEQFRRLAIASVQIEKARDLASTGWIKQACTLAEASAKHRQEILGNLHPDYATSISWLSTMLEQAGDFNRALELQLEVVEINRKIRGEKHFSYGQALHNLAGNFSKQGDIARAVAADQEAFEIVAAAIGAENELCGAILLDLGSRYAEIGDRETSRRFTQRAVETIRAAKGEENWMYAAALNHLGLSQKESNLLPEATATFERAVKIQQGIGVNPASLSMLQANLADCLMEQQRWREAEQLYQQVSELQSKLGAAGDQQQSMLGELGRAQLLYKQGRKEEAIALYAQVVENSRRRVSKDLYLQNMLELDLLFLKRSWQQMPPLFQALLHNREQYMLDAFAALGERQRLDLLRQLRGHLDGRFSLASIVPAPPQELYDHVLVWKGAVAARSLTELDVRNSPEFSADLQKLRNLQMQIVDHAYANPPHENEEETWQSRLEEMRTAKEELQRNLALRSRKYARQSRLEGIFAADIAESMPAGVVLVDFFEYTHLTLQADERIEPKSERRITAFVTRKGSIVQVDLGNSSRIEAAIRDWRSAVQENRPEERKTAGSALKVLLWDPLVEAVGSSHTVLICPDGAICRFPFAALPGEQPNSYLIEHFAFGYVISGRHAVLAEEDTTATGGLLAVGGVDYQSVQIQEASVAMRRVLQQTTQRAGLDPLPGSAREVENVREIFGNVHKDAEVVLLQGGDPHRQRVFSELQRQPRYVHLATHGFFTTPDILLATRSAGSAAFGSQFAYTRQSATGLHPLLLSGLVFAGALEEGVTNEQRPVNSTAIMTAEEVSSLDLRTTDLVVLSACETGLGEVAGGEGVLGLQRAFQTAGANTVVASLWKVDDSATNELMSRFYENLWIKKLPKLQALREAQLDLLRGTGSESSAAIRSPGERVPRIEAPLSRRDPSVWACWVMSGNPGRMEPSVIAFTAKNGTDSRATKSENRNRFGEKLSLYLALVAIMIAVLLISTWRKRQR